MFPRLYDRRITLSMIVLFTVYAYIHSYIHSFIHTYIHTYIHNRYTNKSQKTVSANERLNKALRGMLAIYVYTLHYRLYQIYICMYCRYVCILCSRP